MNTLNCYQRYVLTKRYGRPSKAGSGRRQFWACIGVVVGLVGGTLLPLVGLVMIALAWLIGDMDSILNKSGSMLLMTTIPLLTFGGYCLDIFDKNHSGQDNNMNED